MMSEEDDVFLSEHSETHTLITPGSSREYTQIYGNDDIVPCRRSLSNHSSHHGSQSSFHSNHSSTSELQTNRLESISEDAFNDTTSNCDVYINNPLRHGNTFQPSQKRRSLKSQSSEEDLYEDVHIDRNGATKPLMFPRQHSHARPISRQLSLHRKKCKQCCCAFFYVLLIIGGLALFAFIIVFLVKNYADNWLQVMTKPQNRTHTSQEAKVKTIDRTAENIVGCSSLSVEDVWAVGIPKLMTESAFRLVDVNSDGVLDILFGFASGAEGYDVPELVCDIYFGGLHPCLGGLLALDGTTGQELWRHYSPHEVFAINCNEDLDADSVRDCLVAGRVGTFEAVSGIDGHLLWNFTHPARVSSMNLYTPQFVRDLDGDGVADIINIHGGDPFGEPGSATRLVGRLFLFSGVDGSVLQWTDVPDGRESYYSPVVCQRGDGVDVVVFGTGGETHSGSLWSILLDDLYKGDIHKARQIVHNPYKGFMTPPIMLDLNRDGVEDLIFASYNSTVLAIDGETFSVMWNFSYPLSETYATPAPGYYNEDDVPDFLIHWQHGPGFPVYFHAITTILDGRDGTPLLKPYIQSSVGAQTSPLTVSVEGFGNDIFLHWNADCSGHEGEGGAFTFINGTNVHEQSRSDVCRLRFKSDGFSRLYALSRHQKSPGLVLYNSEDHLAVENSAWINTTEEAMEFLGQHPEHWENYAAWQDWVADNIRKKEQGPLHQMNIDDRLPDPRNHLQQSLDMITGQQAVVPGASSHLRPVENSDVPQLDEDLKDLFGIKEPLDPYEDVLKSQWSRTEGKNRGASSNAGFGGSQSDGNLDENSYEYLKKIYDALGLDNDIGAPKKHYPDLGYGDLEQDRSSPEDRRIPGFDRRGWDPRQRQNGGGRKKRHVGPHDEGGLQRLISTGTLAPPLLAADHPDHSHSMDVVFATYWFYPAKTEALLPEDQECIERRMADQAERFDPNGKYFGMDDDAFGHVVTKECLARSDHQLPKEGTYNNQHTYNPYNVHMGQLTVYRMRLKCTCSKADLAKAPDGRCSRVLPFDQQQWAAYMGSHGNSHWRPLGNDEHTIEL